MAYGVEVSHMRWWPMGLILSGLLACAAPPARTVGVVVAVPASAASTPARRVEVVEPAWSAPVVSSAASAVALDPTSTTPYGPAVAARFPDPPVEYRTPAFQPGRTTFTSNAELQSFMRSLARYGRPDGVTVKLLPLGSSQTGLPLEALLFTRLAETDAAALVNSGRPTVLLVGEQHGDEPAGSEALLVVCQELAHGRLASLLDRINVVVLPRANPDGARDNRRLSASGIDINRDHLLLRTPEAQAQAQLAREYRPLVVADLHEYPVTGRFAEKFGAIQGFDALLQYAMTANLPPFISKASEEWFRRPLVAQLKDQGLASDWYYTGSADPNDKKLSMGSVQPDTGRNVNGLRNAVSFLIETRGAGLGRLHFKRRVFTHVTAVSSLLQSTAERAPDLIKLRTYVDNQVSAHACQGDEVVQAAATPSEYSLLMLDPQTGADKQVIVSWDSALELRPVKLRSRPCGYWLAADQTDAVTRLRKLGVTVEQLDEQGELRAETYRETARELRMPADGTGALAEGGNLLQVQVQLVPALMDTQPGGYYVPLDQPLAHLVIAALEPDTEYSYVSNRIVSGVQSQARVMMPPNIKMTPLP